VVSSKGMKRCPLFPVFCTLISGVWHFALRGEGGGGHPLDVALFHGPPVRLRLRP
jgi:hypothetical protein